MDKNTLRLGTLTLILSLVACGGGGGGGGAGSPAGGGSDGDDSAKTIEEKMAQDPSKLSEAELKSNYEDYVWYQYKGSKTLADVTPANAQVFLSAVLGDGALYVPTLPMDTESSAGFNRKPSRSLDEGEKPFLQGLERQLHANISKTHAMQEGLEKPSASLPRLDKTDINTVSACTNGGTIAIKGEAANDGTGNFALTFNKCNEGWSVITGTGAASFSRIEHNEPTRGAVYFKQVTVTRGENQFEVSGYYAFDVNYSTGTEKFTTLEVYDGPAGNQYVVSSESASTYDGGGYSYASESLLYESELGYLNWDVWFDFGGSAVTFTGVDNIGFAYEYRDPGLKFMMDEDGDGELDSGYYFTKLEDFFSADLSTLALIDIDELGLPPSVSQPYLYSGVLLTTQEIVVEPGYYYDEDTPTEQLQVHYVWTVNGVELESVKGNILPPGSAVHGDEVQVVMAVSDGTHTAESAPITFTMEDAPATVTVDGLPETVSPGEVVQFEAVVSDPDEAGGPVSSAVLAYGPAGASISSSGKVTWAAQDMLFDTSDVKFGLKSTDEAEAVHELSVTVNSPDVALPVARSVIQELSRQHPPMVGDFIGDGDLEILAMDTSNRIFILAHDGHGYTQSWMYPYGMPAAGAVKQLLALNLDEDAKQEIVVATDWGISAIFNEGDKARQLWESEQHVHAVAAVTDAEQVMFAVLTSGSQYYYSNSSMHLEVLSLTDAGVSTLFSSAINQATLEVAFGNVDNDAQLELVLGNGLVYDTATWNNQWYRSGGFGKTDMVVTDLDGNGVAEIVGSSDPDDTVDIFSVTAKASVYTHTSNVCSIGTSLSSIDETPELIIASCGYGANLTAYSWDGVTLQSAWTSTGHRGNLVGMFLGDSNNDGTEDVHWLNYPHGFSAASTGSDGETHWTPGTTYYGGSFISAGWAEISASQQGAVFATPVERLVYVDQSGGITSPDLSSTWQHPDAAAVDDVNGDGSADLLMARHDGFEVVQLDGMTSLWSEGGRYSYQTAIETFDMNGDHVADAVYTGEYTVNMVDIFNQKLIGSFELEQSVLDIAVTKRASDGAAVVAVAAANYDNGLSLWRKVGSAFEEVSTIELDCTRINFGNVDDDSAQELVCLKLGYDAALIVLEVNGDNLQETHRSSLPSGMLITDFVFDTSAPTNQSILAGTRGDSSDSRFNGAIAAISPITGKTVWTGPTLIGTVLHRSLQYRESGENEPRLIFSTNKAMYLVH